MTGSPTPDLRRNRPRTVEDLNVSSVPRGRTPKGWSDRTSLVAVGALASWCRNLSSYSICLPALAAC